MEKAAYPMRLRIASKEDREKWGPTQFFDRMGPP